MLKEKQVFKKIHSETLLSDKDTQQILEYLYSLKPTDIMVTLYRFVNETHNFDNYRKIEAQPGFQERVLLAYSKAGSSYGVALRKYRTPAILEGMQRLSERDASEMVLHCGICGCLLQDPEHHNRYPCEKCGRVTCDHCAWDVEEGSQSRIACILCEGKL